MYRTAVTFLLALAVLLTPAATWTARGQGVVIPEPPPCSDRCPTPPLIADQVEIRSHRVDVEVDLTSPLTVFEVTGRKRKQLSTVVPTGVVSTGIAVPIPGQAVADGGTGPTVVVVIPPPTFGAPLFWPDIEVEGATLVRTEDVGPRVKALVLARPLEPKTVRVLLDEQAVGTIELGAARGQSVKLESLPARSGERLAASVVVTTPEGDPTDLPTPKVRLEGGDAMPLERVAVGRYRATLPAGYPGAPGTEVEVVAELPPLPKVTGAPLELDVPEFTRFNYRGGASVTPEFLALLLGLSIYTAGFIAEIVRSGILAVPWGQTEAAAALGFRRGLQLRLIVLPQALRIIVPPTTSNYLNLTKNSSLAVAIGYPDLVSVGNTTLNQTGQAIEAISIYMLVYLGISLSISAFMNWYNKRIALVER